MARAISRIFSVPWSAASTCLTRTNATSRASRQTAVMANRARFSPEPNSTSALASCASSRTGLISPPRRPSAGALDQARGPGRGPGRFERKCRARAPARRRPRCLPREPAVPRAREDWADHSYGPENRATREKVADASSQGRGQVVEGAGAQPLGPAAQPEAGPGAAAVEGRGLEVVDQRPDQGQAELAVVDLAVGGVGGAGGRRGPVEVLDALLAHPGLAGDDADDQPQGAQQPRLRREGQADGGRRRSGVGIHGRAATRPGPRSRRRPSRGSGTPWSAR